MAWNRVDIAKSKIFTEESTWKVGIQHSSHHNQAILAVPELAIEEVLLNSIHFYFTRFNVSRCILTC